MGIIRYSKVLVQSFITWQEMEMNVFCIVFKKAYFSFIKCFAAAALEGP